MSRLFVDESSEKATVAVCPVTEGTDHITIACWVRPDETGSMRAFGLFDSGSDDQLSVGQHFDGETARVELTGSSGRNATTVGGLSVNTWNHLCATAVLSAGPNYVATIYLNGGDAASTASTGGVDLDKTSVGARDLPTPGSFWSGRVAWASVWGGTSVLTVDEILALAAGVLPWRVRPGDLAACYPLWGLHSPEIDLVGGTGLTLTGTARADPPPVTPFSARHWPTMATWPAAAPGGLPGRSFPRGELRGALRGVA